MGKIYKTRYLTDDPGAPKIDFDAKAYNLLAQVARNTFVSTTVVAVLDQLDQFKIFGLVTWKSSTPTGNHLVDKNWYITSTGVFALNQGQALGWVEGEDDDEG